MSKRRLTILAVLFAIIVISAVVTPVAVLIWKFVSGPDVSREFHGDEALRFIEIRVGGKEQMPAGIKAVNGSIVRSWDHYSVWGCYSVPRDQIDNVKQQIINYHRQRPNGKDIVIDDADMTPDGHTLSLQDDHPPDWWKPKAMSERDILKIHASGMWEVWIFSHADQLAYCSHVE